MSVEIVWASTTQKYIINSPKSELKGADQTAGMRMLVCAFVVHTQQSQVSLRRCPFYCCISKHTFT